MNSSIQYRTPNIETKGVVGFSTVNTVRKHCQFALGTNLVSSAPVQNLATPHRVTDTSPLTVRHFQERFALSVLLLAALWVGLCRELSGEWSVNEQYNFGWFVPFFALYLFWLRWQDRPQTEIGCNGREATARLSNPKSAAEPWELRDRRQNREDRGERARAASEFQLQKEQTIAAFLVI